MNYLNPDQIVDYAIVSKQIGADRGAGEAEKEIETMLDAFYQPFGPPVVVRNAEGALFVQAMVLTSDGRERLERAEIEKKSSGGGR